MNSGTLVASLIMAGVLALVIAFIIQLMMRGWRKRAQRQAELIGTLPEIPDPGRPGEPSRRPASTSAAPWRRPGASGSPSATWVTAARRC